MGGGFVRRRELLRSIGALVVVGEVGAVATDLRADGHRYSASARTGPDTGRQQSVSEGSLRALGERMDPMRPATRLRGNGTPYRRRGQPGTDPDGWSEDASHLVLKRDIRPSERDEKGVRSSVALSGAYDFGLAHRRDKGIVESHRFTQAQATAGNGHSLRSLVDRHEQGTETKWLVYNTWLAPAQFTRDGIPNADQATRKDEIGRIIGAERYDVALLNEVFHGVHPDGDPPGEAIRNWADNGGYGTDTVIDHVRGPGKGGKLVDSGLLGFTMNNAGRRTPRIVSHAAGSFDDLSGQDTPANKGWLYLEIDVGPGNVDVFLTHANSKQKRDEGVLFDDHFAVREQNINTVLEAVHSHGKDANVTVVCGDLNVRGDFDQYDWLLRRMDEYDLHDAYLTRGGIETSTSYYDDDLIEDDSDRYTPNCRRHGEHCHCDDYVVRDETANTRGAKYVHHNRRLDYVFVEEPRSAHALDLDLLRIHRRIFPRYAPVAQGSDDPPRCGPTYTVDEEPSQDTEFLSDHMGLEFYTVASPR